MKGMSGLDALGCMLTDGGIVSIRNEQLKQRIDQEDLRTGKRMLMLFTKELLHEGWEIGWMCEECNGSGSIIATRSGGLNGFMRCSYGEVVKCGDCEEGIRWERTY